MLQLSFHRIIARGVDLLFTEEIIESPYDSLDDFVDVHWVFRVKRPAPRSYHTPQRTQRKGWGGFTSKKVVQLIFRVDLVHGVVNGRGVHETWVWRP